MNNEDIYLQNITPATDLTNAKILGIDSGGSAVLFTLANIKGDYKGEASIVTDPGTPLMSQFYTATSNNLPYTNFKDSSGNPITIPFTYANQRVLSARLVYTGTYWSLVLVTVDVDGIISAQIAGKANQSDLTALSNRVDIIAAGGSESVVSTPENADFIVTDQNGYIAFKIDQFGTVYLPFIQAEIDALSGALNVQNSPENGYFELVDESGNIGIMVDALGNLNVPGLNAVSGAIASLVSSLLTMGSSVDLKEAEGYDLALTDQSGNIGFYIKNGKAYGDLTNTGTKSPYGQIYDIEYYIIYGQSLSVGALGTPVLTTSQKYNNIMFTAGPRFWEDTTNGLNSFVPLIEKVGALDSSLGETSCSGLTNILKQLLSSLNGIQYTDSDHAFLASTPGYGGRPLAELSDKSGTYYTRLIASVTAGATLAKAAGKTFGVRGIAWVHGNADVNSAFSTYLNGVIALKKSLVNDVRAAVSAVMGYTNVDVPFVSYQYTRNRLISGPDNVGLAQLQAAIQEPGFYISGPDYIYSYATNNEHFNNKGNLRHGATLGKMFYDLTMAGISRKPFVAQSHTLLGNTATVLFNPPSGKLKFDTTLSIAKPNNGFSIVDGGTGAITILSTAIALDGKSIRFTFSRPIVSGDKLQYARNGTGTTDSTQNGGNVRDTQGDTIIYDPTGENWPVYNWLLMHEYTF